MKILPLDEKLIEEFLTKYPDALMSYDIEKPILFVYCKEMDAILNFGDLTCDNIHDFIQMNYTRGQLNTYIFGEKLSEWCKKAERLDKKFVYIWNYSSYFFGEPKLDKELKYPNNEPVHYEDELYIDSCRKIIDGLISSFI